VIVHVDPDPVWERRHQNLVTKLKVSVWEALLGCKKMVTTIDGSKVEVVVPECSGDGTILRIANRGMPGNTGAGDLLLVLNLEMPKNLTENQRQKLESIRLG
jgi:molecular chaperone DnaJ